MTIALYALKIKPEHLENYIIQFLEYLQKNNIKLKIWEEMETLLSSHINLSKYKYNTFSTKEDLYDVDRFFTFGGDGTILSAITIIEDLNVPIIGINTGRLGFLASIHISEFLSYTNELCLGEINYSERSLIGIEGTKIKHPYALNEITVLRKETTSMITIETWVDDVFLNTFWADGLIISTPTGSTGYSLSCGGPIISPENSNFVITPIAPHNLNVRPLIIPDNSQIKLKILSRVQEFSMSLDSRLNSININVELLILKAEFTVKLGFPKNYDYFSTIRKKLLWGVDARN